MELGARRGKGDVAQPEFSEQEREALGTAITMARAAIGGFTIDAKRVDDRATCDGLVRSGHLVAVEGVDGGYALSEELAAALGTDAARRAEPARN